LHITTTHRFGFLPPPRLTLNALVRFADGTLGLRMLLLSELAMR